jgi:hypothetical protein
MFQHLFCSLQLTAALDGLAGDGIGVQLASGLISKSATTTILFFITTLLWLAISVMQYVRILKIKEKCI